MCAAQEQPVNSASEYKDLRSKEKVQHQEGSGNPTPSKPKGTTKKDSRAEGYDKDGYPIIYCHTNGIIRNLTHSSINCKLLSDAQKKEATIIN